MTALSFLLRIVLAYAAFSQVLDSDVVIVMILTVSSSSEENFSGAPNCLSACWCSHGSAFIFGFLLHRSSGKIIIEIYCF